MEPNAFFKPTTLYREFMMLDMIAKNTRVTQRKMSDVLGVAPSMVNHYLDQCEDDGYITRNHITKKTVEYQITSQGLSRKQYLNISYLNASQKVYQSAKANVMAFIRTLKANSVNNVLLYGAGEVADILLEVIMQEGSMHVKAIIDDDADKQGKRLYDIPIVTLKVALEKTYDGIIVGSFTHHTRMVETLESSNVPSEKIIAFFEGSGA